MKISLTIFCVVTLVLLLCCFAGQTDAGKCKGNEVFDAKKKKCVHKGKPKPKPGAKPAAKKATTAAAGATTAAAESTAAATTAAPA